MGSIEGRTTEYGYDAANRLIEERTADGTTHLSYDPENGRLAQLADRQSRESFAYDPAGRLIQQTRQIDDHRFTTGYAYDRQGRLSQKTLPDGETKRTEMLCDYLSGKVLPYQVHMVRH